ncbi:hypothetical protein [Microbispora hainanensis]|uniref:Uncharacterized protein n=1 Tax=Microbispora hainanensis TaxID=568844 RepID=A0A544YNR3_9ACTN|nr:hypothetical protein [Microbispora hainanensis]TQS18357.1 hypothetical protein FLX08_24680 [Microbispora hainanensis]
MPAWRLPAGGSYLGLLTGLAGFGLGAATADGLRSAVLVAAVGRLSGRSGAGGRVRGRPG